MTRIVLPVTLVAASAGTLLWTGWRSFVPVPTVDVVPVSLRAGTASSTSSDRSDPSAKPTVKREGAAVQAPGWIEPSPFAVMVPALTPGVVRTVLVLEGERVEAGQVLVEMNDEEQRIGVRLAEAALAETRAKRREMEDELSRKARLVDSGAASAGEVSRLKIRIDAMRAAEEGADAERAMRALILERTKVRAPIAGVVMARLAVPGMIGGGMQDGKPLIELYDPSQLQVRADVPLADAGRIAIGDRAEVTVDVLPDRAFRAEIIRVVHQADIAKNTVQAKVRIIDPDPALKPEMLARVKLFPQVSGRNSGSSSTSNNTSAGPTANSNAGQEAFWVREDCVDTSSTPPSVLLIAGLEDGRGTIERRAIGSIGEAERGWR
ncbi:MAG: efflux RND transporter periplasmic adaptor subunit, partial [Planctomycetes bacterium]|nr:efflux RND transporter periplasmic adaptor subunit [Planctomycetota bacterium]